MRDVIECEITGRIPSSGRFRLHDLIRECLDFDCTYEIYLRIRPVAKMVRKKNGMVKIYK